MALVFVLTFNVVGLFLQDILAGGIEALTEVIDKDAKWVENGLCLL